MRITTQLGLLALLAGATFPVMAIEQPRYDVLSRDADLEIRRYAPYLVAETFVDASFGDAGNEGFSRLFRYITGANTARAEISMTAPVSQQPAGTRIDMTAPVGQVAEAGGFWISFVVPSSFTADTVPQPVDARVRIREVPSQLMAVARYAGTWREARYQTEEQRLRAQLVARGLDPAGDAQFARYNPPYMPPFLRRNEILIPLADQKSAGEATLLSVGAEPAMAQ